MAEEYLAVTLPDEMYNALTFLAERKGKTVQDIIREAIRFYVSISMHEKHSRLIRPWEV